MNQEPDPKKPEAEYFLKVQFRIYHNKELPGLIGINKRTLNRDLKPHRLSLGKRMGYYWTFQQVSIILKIFGIAYVIAEK